MSDGLVDLLVEDADWTAELPELDALAEAAAMLALEAAELDTGLYAVSLLACDDARIAALNAMARGKEGPTNVLSWPAFDLRPDAPGQRPPPPPAAATDGRTLLGDVAIALQTCRTEAETQAKPLKNHVTHLILHGCLHLLGYDHETPEDAGLMEGLETRMLGQLGIPDPYVPEPHL